MRNIPIGEYLLRAKGALSLIEANYKNKDYTNMWKEQQVFNIKVREALKYTFDENNFIEQTVWKPLLDNFKNIVYNQSKRKTRA